MPFVRSHRLALALGAFWLAAPLARAHAQDETYPDRCGVGAPTDERAGYVTLPRGDVFCPLIADPKAMRSFVTYQRGQASHFAQDIAAVGIADQFAFFRFGSDGGSGIQFGAAGAVFAQFDLGSRSYDLLNADYLIALPLTFRAGGFSGRARISHQSSHLGDEFLLRPGHPDRQNLSFESAELLLSQDVDALRVYAGGEAFLDRDPHDLAKSLVHVGAELRPRATAGLGNVSRVRLIAAGDLKVVNDSSWKTGISVKAGFEFARVREGGTPGRRYSLLAELYSGPSPYGQFHRDDVRLMGLGFHFTL